MEDYTAYMLAEMLTGTFKPYGSAYGHGVAGVNMGAKQVQVLMAQKLIINITYLTMQLKIFG